MKRLQQVFTASGQTYGGLLLDLHCNRLGPSALFQVNISTPLPSAFALLSCSGYQLSIFIPSTILT